MAHHKSDREAISARQRFEVLRRCNFACYYCGVPAALGVKQLHVEHVIPVALGGTSDPWNLVSACWDCNAGKAHGVPPVDLIERVRSDYCAYVNSMDIEAQPCAWCKSPVVREFPNDEDPLYEGQECGTCNEVFHSGYDQGIRHGYNRARDGYTMDRPVECGESE